ncbi:hypothetical protein BC332_32362 [Capsicum chinense]|nr:hypothetical protein BC332_32362 [Capsicum chinense]
MKRSAIQREGHTIEEEHVVMAQLADVNAWAYGHEQEAAIPIPVQQNHVQEADVHKEGGEEVEKEDIQEAAILIPVQQNPVQEAEADDEEAGEEVEQEEGEQEENVDFQEQENVEEFDNDDDEVDEEEDQELAANDDDEEVPHEADNDDDEVPHEVWNTALGGANFQLVIEKELTDIDVNRFKLSLPKGNNSLMILIFNTLVFLVVFLLLLFVLSGYAKNKRFCDAADVFEAMPEKNVVSYNAMLSEYLWIGDFMSARKVFDEIGEINVLSWNAMINGHLKVGRMTEACELFDDTPKRNEVSYTIMILGCVGVIIGLDNVVTHANLVTLAMKMRVLLDFAITLMFRVRDGGEMDKHLAEGATPLDAAAGKGHVEETSSTQYILQQYTTASGGQKLQNIMYNAYAMGKVRMLASDIEMV